MKNSMLIRLHNSNIMKNFRNYIRNFFWIISLPLAVEAFLYKIPYFIVLGFLLLSYFVLLCPYLNRITGRINILLTCKQKWFIGVITFIIAAYSIDPNVKEYYRSIISIILILLVWISTIIYSKK